jgi:agmatinase
MADQINFQSTLFKRPQYSFESLDFSSEIQPNTTHLLGFEFDGTACFRKGSKYAPDEIRRQSHGIETFSPYLDHDIEHIAALDLGNLPVGSTANVEQNWQLANDSFFSATQNLNLADNQIRFLTLGGEHSISYAPITYYLQQYPDLLLIHLDAHADLRDGYEGFHYSHASIIRRVLDHMGNNQQLIQYGIRSGIAEEFKWMKANNTRCEDRDSFIDVINRIDSQRPIYLTLDLDYFDPAFMPGTGTPEAGGEDFHSFIRLNKILCNKHFIGADVVELAPGIDPTGNSSVFASTIVRELLLSLELSAKRN